MTENQAIERMRYRIKTATDAMGKGNDGKVYEDMEMAIKALEEIEKYRAIGTVEKCWEAMEKQKAKNPVKHDNCGNKCASDRCPNCFEIVNGKYCENCGQAILGRKRGLNMFKLKEPNEEVYALWVNEKQFSMFDLFYTDAGYKTISGKPIKNFKNRHGHFIIYKEDKTISFTNVIEFTGYQDKEYFLIDLINKVDRRIDRVSMISEQVKELRIYSGVSLYARQAKAIELLKQAADTIESLSAKLQAANGIIEAMAEEIENCYGRETELTERAMEYINNQNKGEPL